MKKSIRCALDKQIDIINILNQMKPNHQRLCSRSDILNAIMIGNIILKYKNKNIIFQLYFFDDTIMGHRNCRNDFRIQMIHFFHDFLDSLSYHKI